MDVAEELLDALRGGPFTDVRTSEPFSAVRTAGDGVMRVGPLGTIAYASPNAVNIMRLAGVDSELTGMKASGLPGGGFGIAPALGTGQGVAVETPVAERVLGYRTIDLPAGALVLVEDLTEAHRREQEIKVKDATIREVHHRVKNNLQTIASLLRIQARRSDSPEVRRALAEATERVGAMAVVHDLLAGSDEERVDFSQVATTVVDLVRRGLVGEGHEVAVKVEGQTGEVDARTATSLALALAELVHNALEHGIGDRQDGRVDVTAQARRQRAGAHGSRRRRRASRGLRSRGLRASRLGDRAHRDRRRPAGNHRLLPGARNNRHGARPRQRTPHPPTTTEE